MKKKFFLILIISISFIILMPYSNAYIVNVYMESFEIYEGTYGTYGTVLGGNVQSLKYGDGDYLEVEGNNYSGTQNSQVRKADATNQSLNWNYSHATCNPPDQWKCIEYIDGNLNMSSNNSANNEAIFSIQNFSYSFQNREFEYIRLDSFVRRTGNMNYSPIMIDIRTTHFTYPNWATCASLRIYESNLQTINFTWFQSSLNNTCYLGNDEYNITWESTKHLVFFVRYLCSEVGSCNETIEIDYVQMVIYYHSFWDNFRVDFTSDYMGWESYVLSSVNWTCARTKGLYGNYDDYILWAWKVGTGWDNLGAFCPHDEAGGNGGFALGASYILNERVYLSVDTGGVQIGATIQIDRLIIIADVGVIPVYNPISWEWIFVFFFAMIGLLIFGVSVKTYRNKGSS